MTPQPQPEIIPDYWDTDNGKRFIEICGYILNDGAVTPREVSRVARALGSPSMVEPPQISSIREMLLPLWDRDATQEELWVLKDAILEVLPETYADRIFSRQRELEAEKIKESQKTEPDRAQDAGAEAIQSHDNSLGDGRKEGQVEETEDQAEVLEEEEENGLLHKISEWCSDLGGDGDGGDSGGGDGGD